MATKYKLSWRAKEHRWQKKHRGKTYYFPAPEGKLASYQRCLRAWKAKKAEIESQDAEASAASIKRSWDPIVHLVSEIQQQVLEEHGDTVETREVFEALQRRYIDRLVNASIARLERATDSEIDFFTSEVRETAELLSQTYWQLPQKFYQNTQTTPPEQPTRKPPWESPESFSSSSELPLLAERFIESVRADASVRRAENVKREVDRFLNWLPDNTSLADAVSPSTLDQYLVHIKGQSVASKTKADRIAAVKQFVLWLYHRELIDEIPRLITARKFSIEVGNSKIEIFEDSDIEAMLKAAREREQLYILLALNAGMTQVDISDLRREELNLEAGTITRKRSKTRDHKTVPTVTYKLWPETLSLLQKHVSKEAERVLVNINGDPLVDIREAGEKTNRTDAVAKSMQRLRNRMKRSKPISFKIFRKTAASKLGSNDRFSRWAGYFLGHAPASTADRHYVRPNQHSFDEAIDWLRDQFIHEEGVKAEP